ncbi:insulin-like growth factor-binding protein 6b [Erpetoichthys calabaricus]|uniref:Insulin-like growth factor binding protein 6b n=1 Tax=Erpetoichthys calabaricus TaxID=27687 RepID=A0A8C4X714_ERPCA|nr:insulin-like growth factor-binding protein 6b [Erpetoichthys calabaricus]
MPFTWLLPFLVLLLPLCHQPGCQVQGARQSPGAQCVSCQESGGTPEGQDSAKEASDAARMAGESCGVYTARCMRGLRCVPRPGEKSPLLALLQNRGVCTAVSHLGTPSSPRGRPATTTTAGQQGSDMTSEKDSKSEDMAPCRQHLKTVLMEHKLTLFHEARSLYIPNCDTNGFYRKKQCRSSKGTRRGMCWCVSEFGHPLPGHDKGGINLQCDGD